MFATLSIVRLARQMLAKILRTVGVTPPAILDPSPEELLALEAADADDEHQASWPLWLFFAVAIGGPYMIYRLLNSEATAKERAAKDKRRPVKARAVWDFNPRNPRELGFKANDILTIFPPQRPGQYPEGWVLAGLENRKGLVPADYVRMQKPEASPTDSNNPDGALGDAFAELEAPQQGQQHRHPGGPVDMGQVFEQEQRAGVANTWADDRSGLQASKRISTDPNSSMWWDDAEVPWPQDGRPNRGGAAAFPHRPQQTPSGGAVLPPRVESTGDPSTPRGNPPSGD